MNLEDEFEFRVPDEDFQRLVTVGDVIDYVRAKQGERAAGAAGPGE